MPIEGVGGVSEQAVSNLLTLLSAQFPASLGAKAATASFSVVAASDTGVQMGGQGIVGADGTNSAYNASVDAGFTTRPFWITPSYFNGTTLDRMRGDVNGLVIQPALSATFWQFAAATGGIVSSTADVALHAAAGVGVRNYLSSLQICHDLLSAVTEYVVKDGSTIIHRGKLQTPAIDGCAGAGSIKFDPPLRGSANTALNFALITSVTGGVFVNAQGYTGA